MSSRLAPRVTVGLVLLVTACGSSHSSSPNGSSHSGSPRPGCAVGGQLLPNACEIETRRILTACMRRSGVTVVGGATASFARPTGGTVAAVYRDGTAAFLFTKDTQEADHVFASAKTAAAAAKGPPLRVARKGNVVYVSNENMAAHEVNQIVRCLP